MEKDERTSEEKLDCWMGYKECIKQCLLKALCDRGETYSVVTKRELAKEDLSLNNK